MERRYQRVDERNRMRENRETERERNSEKERSSAKLGTVICKEAGVCFGRWQQSAAVRDNPPVIKTINPSAD